MQLSLSFRPDGSNHDDIVLIFGEHEWTCDSYYYALDRGVDSEGEGPREDDTRARTVLAALLAQWLSVIADIGHDQTVYLPFDYSDQCTGCIRVHRLGDAVTAALGWSNREGWSTYPSDISDYVSSITDFSPLDAPSLPFTLEELRANVSASLRQLQEAV